MTNSPRTSPQSSISQPCEFGVWDKELKSIVPCSKPATIQVDEQFFCEEHYVDAIMQVQGNSNEPLPDDLERLIRKE